MFILIKTSSTIQFLTILLLSISSYAYAQKVYKTPSGAKYHLANCHMVKNVSEALSIEKAISLGLEPCKICKPGIINASGTPNKKVSGEGNSTVQCRGKTKSGKRCLHRTSIANGYCFQHQPKE